MFTAKDIRKIGINARMDLISNCCGLRIHTKRVRSDNKDEITYWCDYKPEIIRKF
jgi:hypothetical protein